MVHSELQTPGSKNSHFSFFTRFSQQVHDVIRKRKVVAFRVRFPGELVFFAKRWFLYLPMKF
jgi:hypothetical protein